MVEILKSAVSNLSSTEYIFLYLLSVTVRSHYVVITVTILNCSLV